MKPCHPYSSKTSNTYLGLDPSCKAILEKEANIATWGDLLEYYPYKYVDRSRIYRIIDLYR
ncbi:MAG: hypothetical protein ACLTGI_09275 [Hoylesella buccalis]